MIALAASTISMAGHTKSPTRSLLTERRIQFLLLRANDLRFVATRETRPPDRQMGRSVTAHGSTATGPLTLTIGSHAR
jgi:hypothetical protein